MWITAFRSGVYTVGSTASNNIVQTIVGGQVETFAPDAQVVTPSRSGGATVHRIDGIDRDDYVPHVMRVR